MRYLLSLLILGVAIIANATPCITTSACPGVEYFQIQLDGQYYIVEPENEAFKADFSDIADGWHDITLIAVYSDVSLWTRFTVVKETIKNKSYYTIYPQEGYDMYMGDKLTITINNRAGKEVGN